jgi:hypothetical protein
MYLWSGNKDTLYRILAQMNPDHWHQRLVRLHRSTNEDIDTDLYNRTPVGAKSSCSAPANRRSKRL